MGTGQPLEQLQESVVITCKGEKPFAKLRKKSNSGWKIQEDNSFKTTKCSSSNLQGTGHIHL
jgi:hypothetical protein